MWRVLLTQISIILEYRILNLSSEVSGGDISQSKMDVEYFFPFPKCFCCISVTQMLSLSCSDYHLSVCTDWLSRTVPLGTVQNPAVTFPRPPHYRFDHKPAHQCSCSKCSIMIWSAVDLPYPSLANSESCSSLLQPREVIPEDWILLISSRALARESRSPESWCWASHRLRITDDGLSWHAK